MSGSARNMAIMRAAPPARSRMPPTAIADKDPDELIEDTRNFVRNSPGIALAGAAVVGFVVARLVKTGLAQRRRRRRRATDAQAGRSRTAAGRTAGRRARPRARSRRARPMRGPSRPGQGDRRGEGQGAGICRRPCSASPSSSRSRRSPRLPSAWSSRLAQFIGPLAAGFVGLLIFAAIAGGLGWYGYQRLRRDL